MGTLSMAARAAPLLSVARSLVKARTFATARPDMGKTYVVGVGMTKFEKPGRRENFDYPDMAKEAVDKAMADSGLKYTDVEQACVGYVYGDSTCGQRALYPLGMTGIPVYNVNNNCATGSSALFLAHQLVGGSIANCVLALGFEKMQKGSLAATFSDRANPVQPMVEAMMAVRDLEASPIAAQLFAKIAWKNHKHSANNPCSQFQDEYSLEQIQGAPMVHQPLTKLHCCPTSDGGAAAIVVSEDFVKSHGLEARAVEIVGMEMPTDLPSALEEKSCIKAVGFDMTKNAVGKLFNKTGLGAGDVQVVELHDCFSANELVTYEALGLCPEGGAGAFIDAGDNTYGGKFVVNPSGGLISKGHPLGATGLAQCNELVAQLRGEADKRQVNGATAALQHNLGLGGAVVVALYKLGFPEASQAKAKL